jgi:hypothetical protein
MVLDANDFEDISCLFQLRRERLFNMSAEKGK